MPIMSHQSTTKPGRVVRLYQAPFVPGTDVLVKSTVTDSGNTAMRTTILRPGTVLVKKTSDGLYYSAIFSDSNGDRCTAASISSATGITASWASTTQTFVVNGGASIAVTLGGADDTNDEVVTALNADATFQAAGLIADVNSSAVRVRTVQGGAHMSFKWTSSYASTFGASVASAEGYGTDADYRVVEDYVDMLDESGTAGNSVAKTSMAGFYKESNLLNLCAEARGVLTRRGSIFG